MHKTVSLFTLVAAAIAAAWWWLGALVPMPASPLDPGEKLYCVSYAPFRGQQSPLDLSTRIESWQIDQDFARLAALTDCVRIYSVDFGLENAPEIAERHGLKVLLGLWVSGHADRTKHQVDTGIALAKRFPGVIRAVIVGNEALLRGEIAPDALGDLIRRVKSQVSMPVSYADVWEFWLRYRELASAVDFITVHILPYWEDHPIAAHDAANHVASIRKRVAEEFAGRDIVIGEVGWPSAGRMRSGALPSPSAQARALHDILARGKSEKFRVNIIEAFDQPWKRYQEGTVGGHWGLISDPPRTNKFTWGAPVSNHPHWVWQAAGGIVFAALVLAAACASRRRGPSPVLDLRAWIAIAAIAVVGGIAMGWSAANVPVESRGFGGWLRSVAFLAVSMASPLLCAAALAAHVSAPGFFRMIGPINGRAEGRLERSLGWLLIAICILAVEAALGLAFDGRYRDFPFAPLSGAALPFLALAVLVPPKGGRPAAETVAAIVLALSAGAILYNEGIDNWQAVWTCAAIAALALTLARVRPAPGSG